MGIFGKWGKDAKAAGEAQLLEAATKGDAGLVEKLLGKGVSPNCKDADGMTPLHHAAYHGHTAIITALIGANAEVNAQEPSGRTPLMLACSTPVEQANTVDMLLRAGANPNLSYTSGANVGATSLHLAVFTGKTAAVKSLLGKGANTGAKAGDGSTPLHAAAAGGTNDIVSLLLAAKADTAATTNEGLTALHFAAANGHLDIVKQLIERKVPIDSRDARGQTPLHRASAFGSEPVVAVLLEYGADVNAATQDGFTALHGAAMKGNAKLVKLLLSAGANPASASAGGETALDVAADNKPTRKLLRDALAPKPDADALVEFWGEIRSCLKAKSRDDLAELAKRTQHLTALSMEQQLLVAAGLGDAAKVRKLIGSGAAIGWQCDELVTATPLAVAASMGQTKAVRALLELGANVNAQRKDGGTALMDAALNGHVDVVEQLIAGKADVNARGDNNRTAVLLAASNGHGEIVDALVEAGASLDHVLANGLTCIGAALGYGHHELARRLLALGANPEAKNANGFSLLPYHAALKAELDFLKALANAGMKFGEPKLRNDILEAAAERADPELVEFLRSVGIDAPDVDLNRQDKNGYTPLVSAVLEKDEARVRKLLEAGVNTTLRDIDRETALSLAVDLKRERLVKLLREHGAESNDYGGIEPPAAMLKAAADGALGSVLALRDNGVSCNVQDAEGNTPLILAVKGGHHGLVRALCRLGVHANVRNRARQSAFQMATAQNDKEIIQSLKEHSVLDARGESGAIRWGVGDFMRGRSTRPGKSPEPESDDDGEGTGGDLAKLLARALAAAVEAKAGEAEAEDVKEEPAEPPEVVMAAFEGNVPKLTKLAAAGANLEATYTNGLTPLHVAAARGHNQVVELLAKSNVDLNRGAINGVPALVSAMGAGHIHTVELLLTLGAKADVAFGAEGGGELIGGMTPLILAAQSGNAQGCKLLLDHGAAIDAVNDSGYTALMTAIQSEDDETIQLLLNRGANPDPEIVQRTKNVEAFTPLTLAATHGQSQTVALLLKRGVNKEGRSGNGGTALKHAARGGHNEVVDLLLAHHASVEAEDKEGWRSLHNAAAAGDLRIVRALLDAGANPNAQTKGDNFGGIGLTPLMLAAGHGSGEVVDLLLRRKAEVNAQTAAQTTALCNALNYSHSAVAKTLLEAGADPRIGLGEDLPPLQLACTLANQTNNSEDLQLVKMMLARGADSGQEVDGSTILEAARRWGNEKLAALLANQSHADPR